jgi:hypothetical protein
MVSYGPLLDRTHQAWKPRAANAGIVVGILIQFVPRWLFQGLSDRQTLIYTGVSCAVIAVSLFISFGTIRCRACGARWMWRAAQQPAGRWLSWLRAQQACPTCGGTGELGPNSRSRVP